MTAILRPLFVFSHVIGKLLSILPHFNTSATYQSVGKNNAQEGQKDYDQCRWMRTSTGATYQSDQKKTMTTDESTVRKEFGERFGRKIFFQVKT